MKARGKTPAGMRRIDWQPGYWIDWQHPGCAIRDADGNLIAEDLQVSREDVHRLIEKMRGERLDRLIADLMRQVRKH